MSAGGQQKTLEKSARSISGYALRRLHVDAPKLSRPRVPATSIRKQQRDVKRGLFVLRFAFQVAWTA